MEHCKAITYKQPAGLYNQFCQSPAIYFSPSGLNSVPDNYFADGGITFGWCWQQSDLPLLTFRHRVGRVLSFSPVVGIGTPPTPHPQASVPPPLLWFRGEGHTRWRERGWESPNSDEGTYTVVLFIYMCFVHSGIHDTHPRRK